MTDEPVVSTKGTIAKSKASKAPEESDGESRRGWLSWAMGWVALPGAVIGGIFGGGMLVGANFHESWFTRMFVWVFS